MNKHVLKKKLMVVVMFMDTVMKKNVPGILVPILASRFIILVKPLRMVATKKQCLI